MKKFLHKTFGWHFYDDIWDGQTPKYGQIRTCKFCGKQQKAIIAGRHEGNKIWYWEDIK